jgi:hypothetical protein
MVMVSPIQSSMSALMQALMTLVGGIAMCFYVNWRLSLLAFTSVAPGL